MRHLLAAAVLLCGPAMAVDYAKCEARNEAYGRVLAELKQALDNDFDAKLQSKRLAQCALGTPYVRAQCMKKVVLETAAERDMREAPIKLIYAKKMTAIRKDNTKEGCP
jgi:hypothetical protein